MSIPKLEIQTLRCCETQPWGTVGVDQLWIVGLACLYKVPGLVSSIEKGREVGFCFNPQIFEH